MTREEVMDIFYKTEAFLEGHFLLSSGLHSPHYFQCAKVLQYPWLAEKLCWEIASHFMPCGVETVVAPAIGGIVVAQEVARLIRAKAIFAEREADQMILRRGFEIKSGERTLVVEDVVTTGGSVKEVLNLAQRAGAQVVGVACIVDRSSGRVTFPVEKFSVLEMEVIIYKPQECPLCHDKTPLVKPGSRQPGK